MTVSPGTPNQRGFALLTVIVIVMALTILGLSLFSLSSFEAQFFRPTMDYTQAMESTRGGVEWARYVLESTDSFDKVRQSTKPPGVSGVVARKGLDFDSGDSTGSVFDDPKLVWVRSVGSENGREGVVLARFNPNPGQDLYKRLITAMDSLVVYGGVDGLEEFGNTSLQGNIRLGTLRVQDYDGTAISPASLKGPPCVAQQSFVRPELDLLGTWWQQKISVAQEVPATGGQITIGPAGTEAGIYITDPGEVVGGRSWSVGLDGSECTVNVRGTSVWMFPNGLRCEKQLQIKKTGGGNATLILVGRPGPPTGGKEDDIGFALLGGIDVAPGISVFIISNGGVEIEHWLDAQKQSGTVGYVSIYANYVKLMGPQNPGASGNSDMVLAHGTCATSPAQDAKDGLVDQLIEKDLLPNSRFARRRLQFVAGSWEEKPGTVGN